MSTLDLFGLRALDVALDALKADERRRAAAHRRVSLYRNKASDAIGVVLDEVFTHPQVRAHLARFKWAANAVAFYARIVDEVARPVYHQAPIRRVKVDGQESPEATKAYRELARQMRLDRRMDLALRLCVANASSAVVPRYVARRQRVTLDVVSADAMTVVPDPSIPTEAYAVILDLAGKKKVWWDPEYTFTFDAEKRSAVANPDGSLEVQHAFGAPPVVFLHRRERWGTFFDDAPGADLEAAQLELSLLNMLALRLLKAQGFNQIHASGDVGNIPKGQPLDEETALVTGEDTTVTILPLKSDAAHYLALFDKIRLDTGARYGLSASRLNQDATVENWRAVAEIGLMEQRDSLVTVALDAEAELFDLMKIVSREHADASLRLPENATLEVTFVPPSTRADRADLLALRQTERSMLLKNTLDFIREDDQSVQTEEEAKERLLYNLGVEIERVTLQRSLDAALVATPDAPGVSPQTAGRVGVMVRDGELTRDQASKIVSTSAASDAGSDEG